MKEKGGKKGREFEGPVEIDPNEVIDLLPENELFRPMRRFVEEALNCEDAEGGSKQSSKLDDGHPRMW